MKTGSQSSKIWQKILLFSTGSISLIIFLILFGIWRTSDRVLSAIAGLFQPQPLTPQIEIPTLMVEKIQGVQELTTTV